MMVDWDDEWADLFYSVRLARSDGSSRRSLGRRIGCQVAADKGPAEALLEEAARAENFPSCATRSMRR